MKVTLSLLIFILISAFANGQYTTCATANANPAITSGTCLTNQSATTAVPAANCGGGFNSGVGRFYKFVAGSCNQFDITFNNVEEVQFNLWSTACANLNLTCQGETVANQVMSHSYGSGLNTGNEVALVSGTTYILEVVTRNSSNFSLCFNANEPEEPSNECSGAVGVGPTPSTLYNGGNCNFTGSLYDATTSDPAPATLCAGSLENTQWSTFQPVAGSNSIQIVGTGITCGGPVCKWQFGIFSGSCGSLVPEGCISGGSSCQNGSDPTTSSTAPAGGNGTNTVSWSFNDNSFTGIITPSSGTFTGTEVFYLVMDGNANSDCQYNLSGFNIQPLPIELMNFYAKKYNNANMLIWEVASEKNNDRFEIERSLDGLSWFTVRTVFGAGTSDQQRKYSIIDERIDKKVNYYRLAQYDYDGKVSYSRMISVDNREYAKSIVAIYNLMGQEVDMGYNGLKVVTYSDGSTEKKY